MQSFIHVHQFMCTILFATTLYTSILGMPNSPMHYEKTGSSVNISTSDKTMKSKPVQSTQKPHPSQDSDHGKTNASELKGIKHDISVVDDILLQLAKGGLSPKQIRDYGRNGTNTEVEEAQHRSYLASHVTDSSKKEESTRALARLKPIIIQIK